ncbi:MAG: 1-acyl-sn-glycerol-3-phosphate acyltransferase [Bacteroidales bacterium]|jgi:1-acyl-sn-glycerol-3-phosphate acyltransferase|nr:1-acyl-sn-glycerol-3-phosphate acyltransferase [Bacteroidales bacterium]
MNDFFVRLFRYFQKRPMFLWSMLILIIGCCIYAASDIRFVEDIGSFLPQNEDNKRINEAYQRLGAANKIMITVKTADDSDVSDETDRELLMEATAYFAESLSRNDTDGYIKNIFYETDRQQISALTDFLIRNMPYFLSQEDYQRMDTLLTPQYIEQELYNDKQLLLSPAGAFFRDVLIADPLHFSNGILQGLQEFQPDGLYHTQDGFIFNKDATATIISLTPTYPVSETACNKLLARNIDNAIADAQLHFDNKIRISAFGAALISVSNAQQIKRDSLWCGVPALLLILVLLIYFFRNPGSILLIVVCVLFGVLFAFGMIALCKDTVSLIAVGIASVIVGIAINYPLHFLAHYKHTRNKQQTIKEIITPLLIGNITTVGAFLSLLFISSDAMKDLGLFASFLLMGTILFVLVFLPHFPYKVRSSETKEPPHTFDRLAAFAPEKNKWIVSIVLLLTCVFFFFSMDASFETNMHVINYMTPDQRMEFDRILKENPTNRQTIYCIAEGKSTEEALICYENAALHLNAFYEDSLIDKKTGIGVYLPSQRMQQIRIDRWNSFWKDKRDSFLQTFEKTALKQGYNPDAFDVFKTILIADYHPQPLSYFAPVQGSLGDNYLTVTPEKTLIFTLIQTDSAKRRQLEQKINAIDKAVFTFDNVSITEKMIDALSDDFSYVLYICGCLVFVFLLFSFGRIELSIMAFIPLATAWIWILGLMSIFGLKFNIVNVILATFIFGQGDDYTIFVTEGLLYEYTYRKKMLASFKNSVMLSAIIMFLAIGMLVFARHPAMRSLAEVTIIGMVSVVIMTYIFPPLIFGALTTKKGRLRLMPVTLWNLFKTALSFLVFLIVSVIITLIGFFLLTIAGKTKRHKEIFHQTLCLIFRLLGRAMIQTPFKIINPRNERFDKPGIIISNHQSHLDLLYTLMLSPKIITLTNKWVWKSPFYGWIIRYADFLPIEDSIEQRLDSLKTLIADGYSILVFPEGTRSEDCSIGRFHKGAFYLADVLQVDIIPIMLHGVGHVFPKKEFLLRKGEIHIEIMDRISPDHPLRKDKSILEVSKSVRHWYKEEYNRLSAAVETATYFSDRVYHNYIYKGRDVERRAKRNLKRYRNYQDVVGLLPDAGSLLILNCGQGECVLMCSLVKKKLSITAVDSDSNLLDIARSCISSSDSIIYRNSVEDMDGYTVFLIFDPSQDQLEAISRSGRPVFFFCSDDFPIQDSSVRIHAKQKQYLLCSLNLE